MPSSILSQYLCCKENIQVDKNSNYLARFFEKNMNHVSQIFRTDGSIKTWRELKKEHKLHETDENSYFQCLQLIKPIPEDGII